MRRENEEGEKKKERQLKKGNKTVKWMRRDKDYLEVSLIVTSLNKTKTEKKEQEMKHFSEPWSKIYALQSDVAHLPYSSFLSISSCS